jgi:hypothetical protein
VSDDEWALVAPYLTLMPEEAGQCEHALREVFNGKRPFWALPPFAVLNMLVRSGAWSFRSKRPPSAA